LKYEIWFRVPGWKRGGERERGRGGERERGRKGERERKNSKF